MYPKPILDLAGWDIKQIGTGFTSIVIAADDSIIAWGASPTYGELVSFFNFFLLYFLLTTNKKIY